MMTKGIDILSRGVMQFSLGNFGHNTTSDVIGTTNEEENRSRQVVEFN